jgi:hypothetical protein
MRRATRSIVFLLMVGGLVAGLRLLKEIPSTRNSDRIRAYPSIEMVHRHFKRERVLRPAFFPEALAWPPDEVFAGRDPTFASLLHFRDRHTGKLVLAVSQAEDRARQIPSRIMIERVLSTRAVDIHGTEGQLALAVCDDGTRCNRVIFVRDGQTVTAIGRLTEANLLRFARSLR